MANSSLSSAKMSAASQFHQPRIGTVATLANQRYAKIPPGDIALQTPPTVRQPMILRRGLLIPLTRAPKVKPTNYMQNSPARATAHPLPGALAAFPGTVLNLARRGSSVAPSISSRIWRARKVVGAQSAYPQANSGPRRTELRTTICPTTSTCATPNAQVYWPAI
jgi:hypothetical protein